MTSASQPGVPGVPAPGAAIPTGATPPDDSRPEDPTYKWKVLLVVGSGVFMVTLDSGIANVALPVLTREFGASLTLSQWVILGYVLCITALLLPAGRLADMLGRKEVFLGGFAVFAAASALCGLAPSMELLIAARVLQGLGGALMQANMLALLVQAFPARQRGQALGLNGSVVSVGLLSGPVVGGIITEYLGWRWAFYVNVPICAIAAPVGWRLLRPTPRAQGQRFDPAGAALFFVAVVCLLLALNQGETWGWTSAATLGTLLLALGAAAAFVWVERRVAQPTVDLGLFRNRGFSAAVAAAFLSFLAISPVALLMPFYYQLVLGLPADQTGLLLVAIPASAAIFSPIGGSLSDRFGTRLVATAGLLLETAGLASLLFLPAEGSPLPVAARLAVVGVGFALFGSPNTSALMSSVPRTHLGLMGGFQALTRNLASSLGQAIGGAGWSIAVLAAAGALGSAGAAAASAVDAPPEAMLQGFTAVFSWATALAFLAALTSAFARERSPGRPEETAAGTSAGTATSTPAGTPATETAAPVVR